MKCPYCRHEMAERDVPYHLLSPKKKQVFDTILRAGQDGIDSRTLINRFFDKGSPTSLRTLIHNINNVIRPLRIVARKTFYRLERQE